MILLSLVAISLADTAPAEIRVTLDGKPSAGGGRLVVQEEHSKDVTVDVEPPNSELTLTATGDARTETLGDRIVTTQAWNFSGPTGHHEIGPFTVSWKGPAGPGSAHSGPVFVDMGVPPVQVGQKLVDIQDPTPLWTLPRLLLLGVGGVVVLMVGGVWLGFRGLNRRVPATARPLGPDVLALQAWDKVRKDPTLDDLQKATELSRIFREYAEAVLQFPASKWTTTESLERLKQLKHLPEGNLPRAKALLRATDRVKYAGERPKDELFEELDADLRAFVGSTRPHAWETR